MILLETKRLYIKSPTMDDINDWCSLHSDSCVTQYIDGVQSKNVIQQWLTHDIAHQEKHGFCIGSVFHKETNQFVGHAGGIYLNYDDNQPDIELGYVLHKIYWCQGYATELVQSLIRWFFSNSNVKRLVSVTHRQNKKSQRVLEKSGMRFVKKIQHRGSNCDLYEILKEDLEK